MKRGVHAAVAAGVIAVAVVLHLPALSSGLAADDYLQRAMLDGSYPIPKSALDLYSFVDGAAELGPLLEQGTLPWWSHPDLRLSALRPLASLTIALDHRLLGLSPTAQHVHSLLWFALVCAGWAVLARRLLPPATSLLALAIFAWAPTHVMPIGWLANRTAIMSAAFGVLALVCHLRWREDGWRPGAPLSALGWALALGAGEYGLSALAYLVAYELMAGRGGSRQRGIGCAAGVVPALTYLALHVALGYGARGSAVYVDPIATPGKFAVAALVRLPALAGSALTLVPPEILHAGSVATGPLGLVLLGVAIAAVASLLVGTLRRSSTEARRRLIGFALGALLSLLPLAGTLPSSRLLLVPCLGASALLAALFADGWRGVRSAERRRSPWTWLRAAATSPLVALHVLIAPLAAHAGSVAWRDLHARVRGTYLSAPAPAKPDQTLILINAVEPMSLIYPPYARAEAGIPMPKAWRVLSITHKDQKLTRVADDTLELAVQGGGMLEDPVSQLFRSLAEPLRKGDVVELADVRIEVMELAEWGPSRVRYRFARSVDDPSITLLALRGETMVRVNKPAKGQSLPIPSGTGAARH